MKFLLDQNVPVALADWLDNCGHDAIHLKHIGKMQIDDRGVVKEARERSAIILTRDTDFRMFVPRALHDPLQIVLLRIGNATNPVFLNWFEARWSAIEAALDNSEPFIEVI